MEEFANLFEKVDQTQSTNEKVLHLKNYFLKASPADAAWALFFLSGHRIKRLISGRMLLEWCGELMGIPPWLLTESYAAVGDSAETVTLLLPQREKITDGKSLGLAQWMELILPLKNAPEETKKHQIWDFWKQLGSKETFVLNKILTGSFRVGVSALLTLKALSQATQVSREILSQRVMGNWAPSAAFFESLKVIEENNRYLNPYPFYLAFPLEENLDSLGNPSEWLAEWKWDGIRGQAVRRENNCALWSRGNELISHQFPEILEACKSIPNGTVLDGELLAFKNNRPLPFSELQKRLGRKQVTKGMIESVPVVFMIYDILEHQGQDIRELPLIKRREIFEHFANLNPKILVSSRIDFKNWEEIRESRLLASTQATEGVMLKKLSSTYGVGRRKGNWWKYKVDPKTIDAILMYAQAGSGRRANLFTDYTFGVWHEQEIIPIAKAYSGLDQQEIKELDQWIRRNTEEKFGPVRKVKPQQVFEIAFEGIQFSNRHKSGVALRFPRINRWRKDKPYQECDSLDSIKKAFLTDPNMLEDNEK